MYCQCNPHYRRNASEGDAGGYSPERDDFHPNVGEVFQEIIQKKIFVAISSSLLVTISDDKQRLIYARPLRRTFSPVAVPLWEIPDLWGIGTEAFNQLMQRVSIRVEDKTEFQHQLDARLTAAVRDISNGMPPTQAVEKHKVDFKTLKKHFQSIGRMDIYQQAKRKQIRRKPGSSGTYKGDAYWHEVLNDIRAGMHYADVAAKWGMNTPNKRLRLFDHLRRAGLADAVKLRDGNFGRAKVTPADWLLILTRIIEGQQVSEAIQEFDITRTAVNSFLKRYGTSPKQLKDQGIPLELKQLLELAIAIS